ncbi:MAG: hypothetical protein JNM18_26380 [Planctomycetaceae bacterium]|nr:hypothetical protein [Planctomycetaceae bacterium]
MNPRSPGNTASLRIVQIGYLDEQLGDCTYEPLLNPLPPQPDESYLFFESRVLADLVARGEHRSARHFGVVSHQFTQKLANSRKWRLPLRNVGRTTFDAARFAEFVAKHEDAPLIALARAVPHSVFGFAEIMHPGLLDATKTLLNRIGVVANLHVQNQTPIYFNYFVAQPELLDDYVGRILQPVIDAVANDADLQRLLRCDSHYNRPWPAALAQLYGLRQYPLHAFIAERLINVYVELTQTPVVYFDESPDLAWPLSWYRHVERIHRPLVKLAMPWMRLLRRHP